MNSCNYCNVINGTSREEWNNILFSTTNFIVMPSLGSLVPGWLLVIPKKHVLNISQLNKTQRSELSYLIDILSEKLELVFGNKVIKFEHGAHFEDSLVGCGVDHAHLHIVPGVDLTCEEVILKRPNFAYKPDCTGIGEFYKYSGEEDRGYWVFSDSTGKVVWSSVNDPESQLFRKLIADKIGKSNQYDYKKNFFIENVKFTIDSIKNEQLDLETM